MPKHFTIIVNPKTNFSYKAIKYFDANYIDYITNREKRNLIEILQEKIKSGSLDFIICGGDGFINNFVNAFMELPSEKRLLIKVGIIPCGKANDLARALNVPFNIEDAFKQILKKRTKKIDLIQVNNCYFVTGGGLGLPTETVREINLYLSRKNSKKLNDLIYLLFVFKKIVFGYKGLREVKINEHNINYKQLMLLSVQNQPFIGRRFRLAPYANNCDGQFEVCIIKKPISIFSNILMIYKIIRGTHLNSENAFQIKGKGICIILKEKQYFMADGELLCRSNKFNIKIVPKALEVYY